MTNTVGILLIVLAIQAAAIVALLIQRTRRARAERAMRESKERFRISASERLPAGPVKSPTTLLAYEGGGEPGAGGTATLFDQRQASRHGEARPSRPPTLRATTSSRGRSRR